MPDNHDHSHHHHDHEDEDRAAVAMDAAQKSLAEAMRLSFRVLTLIMIAVIVAYLCTGIKSIEPQQVGILKIFGKQVGVAREGLVYNWPFPIGEIELINTSQEELALNDFWVHETAKDKSKPLSERRAMSEGLRPGWDGALLTGDRYLLHAKLSCTYSVRRPVVYRRHVIDPAATIRSAVCRAAIRAAARRTAAGIRRTEKEQFVNDVERFARQELNKLTETTTGEEAIYITRVLVTNVSWPLKALPKFLEAQRARNDRQKRIDSAKAEAGEILNSAAGSQNVKKLVGKMLRTATTQPGESNDGGLIGQYTAAAAAGDKDKAQQLLREIDEVLLDPNTSAEAAKMLREAEGQKSAISQAAKQRAERFKRLVAEYRRAPKFMLQRYWDETVDAILSSPTNEKYFLSLGKGKTVVKINGDPKVRKAINDWLRKEAAQQRQANKNRR